MRLLLLLLVVACGETKPNPCPDRMVHVEDTGTCIDRYEAKLATRSDRVPVAVSAEGVLPATGVSFPAAKEACEAAGFHLCTRAEWQDACAGPQGRPLPYGASFIAEQCNAPQDGEDLTRRHLAPGGSFPRCKSPDGAFDLIGNVGEWVDAADETGTLRELRGGSFTSYPKGATCTTEPLSFRPPEAAFDGQGFRCCSQIASHRNQMSRARR